MRREGEGKGRKGGRGGSGYYWDISSGCCDGENDAIDANSSVLCVCVCVCHCSVIAPINKLAVSCMQLCVCVCVRTCVCVLPTLCNSCEEMATYVLYYSWRPHSYICRSKHIVMEIMVREAITQIMA